MNQRFCNGMIHVIRSGDNLYQLSRRYRVPLALILRANPYVDVYNLRPGQEICIPMPCGSGPIAGRGMQQENVETTEQETEKEDYEEEKNAQAEEEKEVSCTIHLFRIKECTGRGRKRGVLCLSCRRNKKPRSHFK